MDGAGSKLAFAGSAQAQVIHGGALSQLEFDLLSKHASEAMRYLLPLLSILLELVSVGLAGANSAPVFQLHVPDLGFGQAVLIDFGETEIVVDVGGGPEFADYLDASAAVDGPIELVILTHAHADHYGGLTALLARYRVLDIWESGFSGGSERYEDGLKAARQAGVTPRRPPQAASTETGRLEPIHLDKRADISLTILHAPEVSHGTPSRKIDINSTSIVLIVEIAGFRILLPGDALANPARTSPAPAEPQLVHRRLD